jgi:hypothetical protein
LLRQAALEQRHLRRIRDQLAARTWHVPWRVGASIAAGRATAQTQSDH